MGYIVDYIAKKLDILPRQEDYAPIKTGYDALYVRRVVSSFHDLFCRPITGPPDTIITVRKRVYDRTLVKPDGTRPLRYNGVIPAINFGSYQYLGLNASDPYCIPHSQSALCKYGWSTGAIAAEGGECELVSELENETAQFVGKESAMVLGMGFGTNWLVIPLLADQNTYILSDSLNHKSIVCGVRDRKKGQAKQLRIFKHNDPEDLEYQILQLLKELQNKQKVEGSSEVEPIKILIIVEGIYSMEGEICKLPEIVRIRNKYHAYLFVDEAHSIGALGSEGKGVCQETNVNPEDVDVLMGTYTKSFGSAGGYIAGSSQLIGYIKAHCAGIMHSVAMSPIVAQQALAALQLIQGKDGTKRGKEKIAQLHAKSNYLRYQLIELGFSVIGDRNSPVIAVVTRSMVKVIELSRLMLDNGIALVAVMYPVTDKLGARLRVCVNAEHSYEQLDEFLTQMKGMGRELGVRVKDMDMPLWEAVGKCVWAGVSGLLGKRDGFGGRDGWRV